MEFWIENFKFYLVKDQRFIFVKKSFFFLKTSEIKFISFCQFRLFLKCHCFESGEAGGDLPQVRKAMRQPTRHHQSRIPPSRH